MKIKRKVSQKNRLQIPIQLLTESGITEGDIVLLDRDENGKITIEKGGNDGRDLLYNKKIQKPIRNKRTPN